MIYTRECIKGHILIPTLKLIRQTRAERLLLWHAESVHENTPFTEEKIFTIGEQYNHQSKKTYSQTSHEVKENILRVQGGHHPS